MSGLITEDKDGNMIIFDTRTGRVSVLSETIEANEGKSPTPAVVDDNIRKWFLSDAF